MNEIRTFIVVSTGHVTKETATLLETTDAVKQWPCLGGPYGEYGWFFYIPDENDGTIPKDLFLVMTWARTQGVDYILFDQDGPPMEALPFYEW